MGCFSTILVMAGFVLIMVSLIRWFEQTAEAVDNGWWNKIAVLLLCPFAVWLFPSRVTAGRASPVPRHEPVRGFGSLPKSQPIEATPASGPAEATAPVRAAPPPQDQPPPGTPKEFLELPKVPPPKPRTKPAVDPDKVAKLKQKMREQGMLPPDERPRGDPQ